MGSTCKYPGEQWGAENPPPFCECSGNAPGCKCNGEMPLTLRVAYGYRGLEEDAYLDGRKRFHQGEQPDPERYGREKDQRACVQGWIAARLTEEYAAMDVTEFMDICEELGGHPVDFFTVALFHSQQKRGVFVAPPSRSTESI